MSISRSHEPDAMVARNRLFPMMGKVKLVSLPLHMAISRKEEAQ